MNGYEKLRQLLCKEEEIYQDLFMYRTKDFGEGVEVYKELELRHILWYIQLSNFSKKIDINAGGRFHENGRHLNIHLDNSLPLSSQPEVCEAIYNYLITL